MLFKTVLLSTKVSTETTQKPRSLPKQPLSNVVSILVESRKLNLTLQNNRTTIVSGAISITAQTLQLDHNGSF